MAVQLVARRTGTLSNRSILVCPRMTTIAPTGGGFVGVCMRQLPSGVSRTKVLVPEEMTSPDRRKGVCRPKSLSESALTWATDVNAAAGASTESASADGAMIARMPRVVRAIRDMTLTLYHFSAVQGRRGDTPIWACGQTRGSHPEFAS